MDENDPDTLQMMDNVDSPIWLKKLKKKNANNDWFNVLVSAACLGTVIPMLYIVVLILTRGYAWLVEPNLFIIFIEALLMGALSVLVSIRLYLEVRDCGKALGAKDRWNKEKREFYEKN